MLENPLATPKRERASAYAPALVKFFTKLDFSELKH